MSEPFHHALSFVFLIITKNNSKVNKRSPVQNSFTICFRTVYNLFVLHMLFFDYTKFHIVYKG